MADKKSSNESENSRFKDAVNSAGLTKDEARRMHEDLQKDPNKDNKSYSDLKETANTYKGK